MNISTNLHVIGLRSSSLALSAVLLIGLAIQSRGATSYGFSDENSQASVDLDGGTGLNSYAVDGVGQLNRQWFYYRIGTGGAESPINSLSAPTVTPRAGGDGLDVVYSDSTIQVTISYWVEGGTPGSGLSLMHADWAVLNLTASALDFHFFQYSDFDLGGSSTDQSVTFSKVGPPFWNRATQTDGSLILTNSFLNTKAISRVQVGDAAMILASLTDGSTTILSVSSGTSTTAGPGNLAFAAQWDFSLGAAGSSTQSGGNNELWGLVVPEPSALALVSCGMAALGYLRRRH
jgi:large repetitive protein